MAAMLQEKGISPQMLLQMKGKGVDIKSLLMDMMKGKKLIKYSTI